MCLALQRRRRSTYAHHEKLGGKEVFNKLQSDAAAAARNDGDPSFFSFFARFHAFSIAQEFSKNNYNLTKERKSGKITALWYCHPYHCGRTTTAK